MAHKEKSSKPYEILNSIRQQQIEPLYLLHGEEAFLIDELVEAFLDALVDPSMAAFNLDIFNGKETDGKKVAAIIPTWPMMGNHRVVVVRHVDQMKKSDREALIPYLEKPPQSTYQIYTATTTNGREKFFMAAKKHGTMVSCDPLYDDKIPLWLHEQFKKINKSIEPAGLEKLQHSVGVSLYDLYNEVQKLDIYTGGRREITAADVEFIVGSWRVNTIFELQKKIGARQTGDALVLIRKILTNGEPPLKIVASLTYFFVTLRKLRALKGQNLTPPVLAGKVGVHPFFVKDYLVSAAKYQDSELERNFSLLFEVDLQLKTSAGVPEALMERLIYQLCAKG